MGNCGWTLSGSGRELKLGLGELSEKLCKEISCETVKETEPVCRATAGLGATPALPATDSEVKEILL